MSIDLKALLEAVWRANHLSVEDAPFIAQSARHLFSEACYQAVRRKETPFYYTLELQAAADRLARDEAGDDDWRSVMEQLPQAINIALSCRLRAFAEGPWPTPA